MHGCFLCSAHEVVPANDSTPQTSVRHALLGTRVCNKDPATSHQTHPCT